MFRVRQRRIRRVRRAVTLGADMKMHRTAAIPRMGATRDTAAVRTTTLTDANPRTAGALIPATTGIPGTTRIRVPAVTAGDRMETPGRRRGRQVRIGGSQATPEGVGVPGTASPTIQVRETAAGRTGAAGAEIAPLRIAVDSGQNYRGDAYEASPFILLCISSKGVRVFFSGGVYR